ncbi:MAG: class I SAM-dependent methyltransferase [Clostridia bacterium]|jgi:SAM-dependent methyltransferase|nr:class I SAM-dependent methyltransferase [Clostridia bacterium]
MERKAAYANLAKWFEYLNDDCGYENWSQYLILKLENFPLTSGLDVGCGGGWFTRAFAKHGYQMTGLDKSAEMLNFAQERALKEGARGEYLLGDITAFKSPKKFSFVTAINDCVNYIPKTKLNSAFKSVYNALEKNGVFLFDISSERKFLDKIANTVSVDDRDDVTYMSFNKAEEDGATMEVTLFVKQADGLYERLDEVHRQYRYTKAEILSALEKAGFTVLEAEGFLGEDEDKSDRLCFLAQKGGKK